MKQNLFRPGVRTSRRFFHRLINKVCGRTFDSIAFMYDITGALMYFFIGVFSASIVFGNGAWWLGGGVIAFALYVLRTFLLRKRLMTPRYF